MTLATSALSAEYPMAIIIDDIESQLNTIADQKGLEAVLNRIQVIAYELCIMPAAKANSLFIPQLDSYCYQMAQALSPQPSAQTDNTVILHVATEIYETGGHTRFIEDTVKALSEYQHVLLITDVTRKYIKQPEELGSLKERFAQLGVRLLFIPAETLTEKLVQLKHQLALLQPQTIFLHVNHYDAVAAVGIVGHSAPHVVFIHHCDHNPALGASRTDYIHADNTPACHKVCQATKALKPIYLGLSVHDRGVIDSVGGKIKVGVTCGSPDKYEGSCGFTYPELLAALFREGVEKILHVGSMSQAQQVEIRSAVIVAAQDDSRLVFVPNVVSLAEFLKENKPDFFLCSYPSGGGKAMVEAMSVGLPILNPRAPETPELTCVDMSFGVALEIQQLKDVPKTLSILRNEGKLLGRRNREMFERHYAMPRFREKLLTIMDS